MAPRDTSLLDRELSWIEFNQRVLGEADEPTVPLFERLFFLGVVSSNLDEFFMVRVGGLHLLREAGAAASGSGGLGAGELLRLVRARVRRQVAEQYDCFAQRVLTGLAARQVVLSAGGPLAPEDTRLLEPLFQDEILPVLSPVALPPSGEFPLLPPLSLYLAVRLAPAADTVAPRHALIRLAPGLPRVLRVPAATPGPRRFVLIEDLVRAFLPRLFSGQAVEEAATFRVTRNADMAVDEEDAPDLAAAMIRVLRERRSGPCVRLEMKAAASPDMVAFLRERLLVDAEDVFLAPGPVDLAGLRELRTLADDVALRYPPWTEAHPALDPARGLFEQIARRDILLATPYESFDPVLKFVETAAADPLVRAIKIVLYRVGARGPLVRALAAAARAGKHVTALIELKARFDEERNIDWARGLEEAGVQVVYGVRHLKTHAKVCLVIRREDDGVRHYLHFGTGNYNEATARLYTDVGLFTCDPALGRDASMFFHAVTGFSEPQPYRKLVQAPNGLRERLLELIRFEARQAAEGQPAQIAARMNALVDPELIAALYEASRRGVEIRLSVRGICCLRPGVPGLSENIVVTGIIDRFLEHSRVFRFLHGGAEALFLSSADWMPRNLDRRVELLVPVDYPACRRRLGELLDAALADNVKAWRLLPDSTYERVRRPHGQRQIRSQQVLCERAAAAARQARKALRTVFEPHLPRRRAPAARGEPT